MAQRTDQRRPKHVYLDAYDKALSLSGYILSVCKPKDKNANNKHIPKHNSGLGRLMMDAAVELGADILEANEIYVGSNLDPERKYQNYQDRIELQEHAKRMTYRIEHIFRILHFDKPFAESTSHHMMDLICDTRTTLTDWKESDAKAAKNIKK